MHFVGFPAVHSLTRALSVEKTLTPYKLYILLLSLIYCAVAIDDQAKLGIEKP